MEEPTGINRPWKHLVDRMSLAEQKAVWNFFTTIDGNIHAGNALLDELIETHGSNGSMLSAFKEIAEEIAALTKLREEHHSRGIFLELCWRINNGS